jgi:hypothetical protein
VCGLLSATPALAQTKEAYACIEDISGGIINKEQSRVIAFSPKKMTMVRDGNAITVKYRSPDGDVTERFSCSQPRARAPQLLQCVEDAYFMMFDTNRMTFHRAQIYMNVDGPSQDSLTVSMGTCQKF